MDLATSSTSKFSDVDEYGFKRSDNFDYRNYEQFMSGYLKTLTKRRMKWEAILQRNADLTTIDSKLKRYIRKGIPGPFRADVWMKISGAAKLQQRSPALYNNLLGAHYEKEICDSITIDLPRTFPDNIHFDTKKERLFNILVAYAHHNREVGYCQGLNYIAGLLLIVTDDEEKSFWLLKHIVESIVPQYHTKNMANLLRDLAVFKEMIIRRAPQVNRHIENLGLPYTVIASKWFICIFAEVLPVETVLRIWDCVFAEGYKIVFRVALALFLTHKTAILGCDDIAALANLFREKMMQGDIVTDCHSFIEAMFKLRLKRSELEALRKVCVGRNNT
nr:growth hormone-regulated TBC protein 1-A isoform X2 [Bactrocera oleae]XP_014094775.1 growth hormone-regulated TBC protein 1-A isoform X2 [Bactrocera oleae]XP_014094776.1 growth hormone-regulated TBC protein 1-A isoform X2 [Bactrocera oleae]XP_036228986.1 growth hormone-regulated TBC protein 1-A isoform X2 [Bactrocera oleae]